MKKRISRMIKRFRRRFPISFRLIREDREHIHQNPVRKPTNVVSDVTIFETIEASHEKTNESP